MSSRRLPPKPFTGETGAGWVIKTLHSRQPPVGGRHAGSLVPLTGLASTFLALAVTVLLPIKDGIDISGWGWLWGTLMVWVLSMFIWVLHGCRRWRRGSLRKRGDCGHRTVDLSSRITNRSS